MMRLSKKEWLGFSLILALFLVVRLPAVHMPYHQDEYKWPMYADPTITAPGTVPHPPLTEFFYTKFPGGIVGYDNFRFIPLSFEFLTLILLYFFVRRRYSAKVALLTAIIFTLSYFSILASLMVDTDGAILPFFFVLCLLFYDSFLLSKNRKKWLWLFFLLVSMILGIMVKISFVLAIGAIALDYIFEHRRLINKKKVFLAIGVFVGFCLLVYGILYISQYIFPGFSLHKGEAYWQTFIRGFGGRNYFQTIIQFFKAIMYSSPFLVLAGALSFLPAFYQKKFRVFQVFIILGLIFYLILFDFSIGALDRYLEFLIIPLCVIAASLTDQILSGTKVFNKKSLVGPAIIALGILLLNFLPQKVPSLYPKTEWIHYFTSLHWNFLFPFNGGSGPTGFYVSFAFIGIIWILSAVIVIFLLLKKNYTKELWIALLVFGLLYNVVFAEEYLFGKINGNAPALVKNAVAFIAQDSDIKNVVVYNDTGGYNVRETGKYERRMYAAPQFEAEYKKYFSGWKGYILYTDIPRAEKGSFYDLYMASCTPVYAQSDQAIHTSVLACGFNNK